MLKQSALSLLSLFIGSNVLAADSEYYSKIAINNQNTLYAINDAKVDLSLSLFKDVPQVITDQLNMSQSKDAEPSFKTPVNTFLIKTANQNILIDAGGGTCLGQDGNKTMKALEELDIDPNKINAILLTHAHTDHTCGLATYDEKNKKWIPNYPNATLFINAVEYDYWVTKGNDEQIKKILSAYQEKNLENMVKYNVGDVLLDTFKVFDAKGHTVGHSAFLWEPEDKQRWMFIGDIIHNTEYQFTYPEITISFDSNPQNAIKSRHYFLEQALKNHWNIAGAHITFPGIGKVGYFDKTYKWLAN